MTLYCVKVYYANGTNNNKEMFFSNYQDALMFFDSLDEEENRDAYSKMELTVYDTDTNETLTYATRRWVA